MNDQVAEVKGKTDIVSVIGERIELKKAGRNFKANCPFHGERTPSFMVSSELQIFKCFGCDAKGDVFTFLERFEGMDFPEALKYLADKVGVKLKTFTGSQKSEKDKIIEINSLALRFYNYMLLNHEVGKKALNYLLNDRGLKKSIIEEFQLGYSPDNSGFLKRFLIDKKKFLASEIERAGIGINRGNFYDRFSGRVIFPLFDHRGNPIGFSGRVLPWDRRETGKYINSPETPTYHKSSVLYALDKTRQNIKKKGVAIIVEGELDAISSYQAGIKNVVAIKGSALTEDQVRLLSRFAQKFILALDADLAGDAAARRGILVAQKVGVEVKVAKMASGKDPDEAARNDLDGYKKSLIESVPIWDFFIDSAFKRYDGSTGVGKGKISKEVISVLSEIDDKIVQAHYIGILAKKLNIPVEAVSEQIGKTMTNIPEEDKPARQSFSGGGARKTLLEERFLSLAFTLNPSILLKKGNISLIKYPLHIRLIEEYMKYAGKYKKFDMQKFSKNLPAELFDGFSQIVLKESQDESIDTNLQKELDLVVKELKILSIREKLVSLTAKIKELEEKGDKNEQFIAQKKFNTLATLLTKIKKQTQSGVIFDDN